MVQGPITGTQDIDDVATLWSTETRKTRLGATVAAMGDADGDGVIDVLALNESTSGSTVVAHLLSAALPDGSTIDDASASITTDAKHSPMSTGAGPGDLDGDGIADATVSGESPSTGWSTVFLGPIMGELTTADSDNIIYGDTTLDYTYAQTGCPDLDGDGARGGDLDQDGYGDVAVGASDESHGDGGDSAAYIFHGPVSGSVTTDAATGTLADEGKSHLPIEALLFLPDLTGDGSSELLLASPYIGEAWLVGGSGI